MITSVLALTVSQTTTSRARPSLEDSFVDPPAATKPAIWWFWGESVTTDHGITQDLEALKRVGFGGVVVYEPRIRSWKEDEEAQVGSGNG